MTAVCRILAISGSLQARSGNRSLLEAARSSALEAAQITIFDRLRALPAFDPDVKDTDVPEPVLALRTAVGGCDALLVASPEYGFSLPGALNAIDWLIGSGELEGKVIGVTAAVKTPGRGQRGLDALLEPLRAVSARIVGGHSLVQGPAFERDVEQLVQAIVREVREGLAPPEHGLGSPRPSALIAEWVERFNHRDADALALLYAPEAAMQPLGEALVSRRDAIRAHYARRFTAAAPPLVITEHLVEDRTAAVLEWSTASNERGCICFTVERSHIIAQREYRAAV